MNDEAIMDIGGKGILNYEAVINMHIMRSNFLFQTILANKGVGIPVMMSLYATLMALDGLIRNKRQTADYDKNMDEYITQIKSKFMELGKSSNSIDEVSFVKIWFVIMDAYNFQLRQMNTLGLTPAVRVTDKIGESIQEKEFVVPTEQKDWGENNAEQHRVPPTD